MFDKLIFMLVALYGSLKDLHYRAAGGSFYSMHKQTDDIIENFGKILESVDDIQEICYMGRGVLSLSWQRILEQSAKYVANDTNEKNHITSITRIINDIITEIDRLSDDPSLTIAEAGVIGAIAENMQRSFGVLHRSAF